MRKIILTTILILVSLPSFADLTNSDPAMEEKYKQIDAYMKEYKQAYSRLYDILPEEQQEMLKEMGKDAYLSNMSRCKLLSTIEMEIFQKRIDNQLKSYEKEYTKPANEALFASLIKSTINEHADMGIKCFHQQQNEQIKYLNDLYQRITSSQ